MVDVEKSTSTCRYIHKYMFVVVNTCFKYLPHYFLIQTHLTEQLICKSEREEVSISFTGVLGLTKVNEYIGEHEYPNQNANSLHITFTILTKQKTSS